MSENLVLVDTDILIDVGHGVTESIATLERLEAECSLLCSVVTQMELIVGCRNKTELRALEKFLQRFQVVQITELISNQAAELLKTYRLSHGLLIADALIASTVLSLNCAFLTRNHKDYRYIPEIQLQ
jgi:predicted nucleic acid-binding protein